MTLQRQYINATNEARAAVAEIVRLVEAGDVRPLVAFDIETMPIRGLQLYPGTTFDDAGERIKPTKKHYLVYVQERWHEAFNPARLRALGLYIPRKLTNGSEAKGVPVKLAWQTFWQALQAVDADRLEGARWGSRAEVLAWQAELEQELAAQEDVLRGLLNPPPLKNGKPGKVSQAKVKAQEVEIEWTKFLLERVRFALKRVEHPLDQKLLRHIVAVGVESRVEVDPVQPGLDPYTSDIFSVQVTLMEKGTRALRTWVFNTAKVPLDVLAPMFRLPKRKATYIAHNAKFDLKHLLHKLGFAPKNTVCTRVGSRMLTLGLQTPHSLKACAERYLNVHMDKAVRDTFIGVRRDELTPEQITYGAIDTELLIPLWDAIMAKAERNSQVELVTNFALLSHLVARWELRGWNISVEEWLRIAAEVAAKRDEVAREVEMILLPPEYREMFGAVAAGDEVVTLDGEPVTDDGEDDTRPDAIIKLTRHEIVKPLLAKVIGMEVESLSKDARGALESEYMARHGRPHPFFELYKKWSKLNKQASTYGLKFLWTVHPMTGRIHAQFHIAGTDTGRFSSTGPNLLNIPTVKNQDDADFRAAFLAPEGYLFGNADYSAMEQRIAADLTHDPTLVEVFVQDGDSHSVTAAFSFHLKQVDVAAPRLTTARFTYGTETKEITVLEVPKRWGPKDILPFIINDRSLLTHDGKPVSLVELIEKKYKKTTRSTAKTVGFLFYFGGSPFGMAKKNNIPTKQAEEFFELFGGTYPVLVEKFEEFGNRPFDTAIEDEDGIRYGYAWAYGGLRRWFRLPHNPSRHEYPLGWKGEVEFNEAQREFRKQCNSVRREAKNVGTQGGNAVIMTEALLRLDELGEPQGIEPALSIYDELLVLVPKRVAERRGGEEMANALIEQAMLEPSEKYIRAVPSKAEANPLSPYWAKFG